MLLSIKTSLKPIEQGKIWREVVRSYQKRVKEKSELQNK